MSTHNELEIARTRLAEAEAEFAAGINPYAARNVETHRARVARLEAAAVAPISIAASIPPAPAPAVAKPILAPAITGTREDRLRRLAKAMGANDRTLTDALANGTTPDEFAMQIIDDRDPEAVALRIAHSDKPVTRKASPEVEAEVQRILNA